jgi:hypothetical protein
MMQVVIHRYEHTVCTDVGTANSTAQWYNGTHSVSHRYSTVVQQYSTVCLIGTAHWYNGTHGVSHRYSTLVQQYSTVCLIGTAHWYSSTAHWYNGTHSVSHRYSTLVQQYSTLTKSTGSGSLPVLFISPQIIELVYSLTTSSDLSTLNWKMPKHERWGICGVPHQRKRSRLDQ